MKTSELFESAPDVNASELIYNKYKVLNPEHHEDCPFIWRDWGFTTFLDYCIENPKRLSDWTSLVKLLNDEHLPFFNRLRGYSQPTSKIQEIIDDYVLLFGEFNNPWTVEVCTICQPNENAVLSIETQKVILIDFKKRFIAILDDGNEVKVFDRHHYLKPSECWIK